MQAHHAWIIEIIPADCLIVVLLTSVPDIQYANHELNNYNDTKA